MKISLLIVLSICLLGLLCIACDGITATPINKILENPRNYDGKTVSISGEVTEIFSLFVIKYFSVKDKTGEIIVVTEKPMPKKGTKITVKGIVKEAFSVGDQQLIVLVENSEMK